MATENDIEQRLASITNAERSRLLVRLILALHDEDTDTAFRILRDNDLEACQTESEESGNTYPDDLLHDDADPGDMDGDHQSALESVYGPEDPPDYDQFEGNDGGW